jgi:hypothetical protein
MLLYLFTVAGAASELKFKNIRTDFSFNPPGWTPFCGAEGIVELI